MSEDLTQEEIQAARMRNTPEPPPPYSGDTQLWAEDLDNYLRRRMQHLEAEIAASRKEIEDGKDTVRRMEALINERSNEATRAGPEGPATHPEGT